MKLLKRTLWICCVFGLLPLVYSASAENTEISKYIPNDDEVSGWVREGEAYIAIDEKTLLAFINGAAPFYIEHGTEEVAFQDFTQKDLYLTLEIYRMKNEVSAKRLYADIYAENPKPLEGIGTVGRFLDDLIRLYLVEYWQQSFFIRLTISEKTVASKETILTFARIVSEKISR